ncbi:MAG TPA: PTS sugar transporter subunit IIA [Acidisphaera sp.]|nr:PTS sugar transporter subunit IIA [Acidisphaera sp.]
MKLSDLISPENVPVGLRVADKAAALRTLSAKAAAATGLEAEAILAALQKRETLGSTGLGRGFAVPHARIEGLDRFFCLFARLARPIDFAAIDEQPVDLLCLLLIPERAGNDHVAALSAIARQMRPDATLADIRRAKTAEAVYARLIQDTSPQPAATT